ncbi:pyridoxal kinase PdxY [Stigmatella aurantiaca]|uniref:pyridoxal kinase n=1 Tax=Stigmatella aurantiaca (strain DW4/3-1) TaxID=378806 RepID=Q09D39_STIAD|nr:pyridoxal kinase PdxY [Stigmatella aurantiaca]ADO67873.1 Pyridoxamine kinase [Stigmatella aurantiaca DW4/3-1]EAU69683.1 pyridoxal kinase [Stigmatella aurantiaca DW4/3-1]
MAILSIQSHVAYGYVGNRSAAFPLQRLGHEVWPVNTVQFSNHSGYGRWRGQIFEASHVAEVIAGIAERGAMAQCQAVLSGYMGDAATGEVILEAVAQARAANPRALYCCDPVIGDVGRGVFVRPGIPEFMRERAVPAADITTPNQFELEHLTGRTVRTLEDALEATAALRERGPKVVLVTSLQREGAPSGTVEMLAATEAGAWRVHTPLLPIQPPPNGAGDAVAALFLAHLLRGRSAGEALGETAASIFGILAATHAAGSRELQLIAAQDELVSPTQRFTVEQVA